MIHDKHIPLFQINPHHAARPELLEVTAYSPTNRPLGCPVSEDNGTFYASFQPDEAGEWRIHVTYDNEDIENSPFRCMVFDPRAVHVSDILLTQWRASDSTWVFGQSQPLVTCVALCKAALANDFQICRQCWPRPAVSGVPI